jgi:predicted AAA+ superfamily ATPase
MSLDEDNPWWTNQPDKVLEKQTKNPIKWVPRLLNRIDFIPYSLHFLTGPRQVGKTTLLHLLIDRLLKSNWDPFAIFYFQCDELASYTELGSIIDDYQKTRNARKIRNSIIILDEITFVKEWWRAIKARIDKSKFDNDVIIITGSASAEMLKEKERFPGRRGNGKDFILYPLDFSEYVSMWIPNLVKKDEIHYNQIPGEIAEPNLVFKSHITELFDSYLQTGGFPLAIFDYLQTRTISPETKKSYLDWLRNDFLKLNKNEASMKEIISYLLQSKLSPISWNSITQQTSIMSPHTVQSYIEALTQLYVCNVQYYISPEGTIEYRKNKKVHFLDPFLARILADYCRIQAPAADELVESIVMSHWNRKYPTFYWKDKTEIDNVVELDKKQYTGYEVKWGPKSWRKPLHLKYAYLLDKDIIPIFLASINWEKNNGSIDQEIS